MKHFFYLHIIYLFHLVTHLSEWISADNERFEQGGVARAAVHSLAAFRSCDLGGHHKPSLFPVASSRKWERWALW